jgi:hypothetical protein
MICRLLIVSLMFLSFHSTAGMIGTDQVVAATPQADRANIQSLLSRAEIASQLQSMGVDLNAAKERVAAMTDEEARSLAGKLHSVPAGADNDGWWIAAIVVVAVLIWWYWARR